MALTISVRSTHGYCPRVIVTAAAEWHGVIHCNDDDDDDDDNQEEENEGLVGCGGELPC